LDVQIGKLAKQVRTLERAELTWRAAVERAGRRPPRTPPKDIAVVIARTLEAAKGTSPAQMKG
jgi:hypothetical protein